MLMVKLLTPSNEMRSLLTRYPGSWTYKHAVGNHIHGASGDKTIAEDAEFMLASQTKLLTTIVALQAVEKGLVGLDDDVDERIPELAKEGVWKGFDGDDKPQIEKKQSPLTLRSVFGLYGN